MNLSHTNARHTHFPGIKAQCHVRCEGGDTLSDKQSSPSLLTQGLFCSMHAQSGSQFSEAERNYFHKKMFLKNYSQVLVLNAAMQRTDSDYVMAIGLCKASRFISYPSCLVHVCYPQCEKVYM